MVFTTSEFVLFALVFFSAFAMCPPRFRSVLTLLASNIFYAAWDIRFLALLWFSMAVDFVVSRKIAQTEDAIRRRRLLIVSLVGNLGVLGFFKYFGFFVDEFTALLNALGVHTSRIVLDIALPVGISFYTFQTLSYTIGVYRRTLKPAKSLLSFALFVCYFPQLVAGPIERAEHLLPQLEDWQNKRFEPGATGVGLILIGFFKKLVLADAFAELANPVFASPNDAFVGAIWVAAISFSMQIYFDFSAYSDIAIGLSRLMGIELVTNFRSPYASYGPSEFWQRWHISLSTWLRDYLYIPLGGNRRGRVRTMANLAATMLLGGLWHGAAWNYVFWGGYHGLLLAVARLPVTERILSFETRVPGMRYLRRAGFFVLTVIGWVIFRAEKNTDIGALLTSMFDVGRFRHELWLEGIQESGQSIRLTFFMVIAAATVLWQWAAPKDSKWLADILFGRSKILAFCVAMGLFVMTIMFRSGIAADFIYFQF